MRRREHRVIVAHAAEVVAGKQRILGATQDLSSGGVFVRSAEPLPVGTLVELSLDAGHGPVRVAAQVVHVLDTGEARSLGRAPGMGLSFAPAESAAPEVLSKQLAEFFRAAAPMPRPRVVGERLRIVVADSAQRLLQRAANALTHAGFDVVPCQDGLEALAACQAERPHVVLAALRLPGIDGLGLVRRLGAQPELAAVPVAIMSHESSDLARLSAYQAGVMDFIPKPFTVAELCIRMRRLARQGLADRVQLRGSLGGISLGALLSLFEAERKTGVLTVSRDEEAVWLTLSAGRVLRARSTHMEADSRAVIDHALDWPDGSFELLACEVSEDDELGTTVTHLLLEHMRVKDEIERAHERARRRADTQT
jgi:DNA-binding response OmpR family regulator